jgi:hypothetical protein
VIRKDEMSAIGDVEATLYIDARLGEHIDFVDERYGVNDDAHADDRVLLGAENAARDELEHVLFLADDDGVAGVVASGNANDVIEGASEVVDYLSLAFVSPLRAHDND